MILLTGVAGFIGMHLARRLLAEGHELVGVDHLGPCVSPIPAPGLKERRLAEIGGAPGFRFDRLDVTEDGALEELFRTHRFERVIHLAAQTGVRHSSAQPVACVTNNLVGLAKVLECSRRHGVRHVLYASSSGAYGASRRLPFDEHDPAGHPVSVYAATKRGGELLAHSYSHLYGLPTTGLRFFTVYGPWGRPDMAPMLFAGAIAAGRPIEVYNGGRMLRDFTYVDDVVESVLRLAARPAEPDPGFDPVHPNPAASHAPFRIYNVGNQQPVLLSDFIDALEDALGRHAERVPRPMPAADMAVTCADTHALRQAIGWAPATPLRTGIARFVEWFQRHGACDA
ncbi:NAD-dependent epimerase/dehydratase family protein [Massilia sp. LXY-6]|uniref:NAD-dependent epimerase/dehydratase family protein n=1 Tax=Massilia sp. LXY-6 TaxID=3379823 RepID=UPI003EDE810F